MPTAHLTLRQVKRMLAAEPWHSIAVAELVTQCAIPVIARRLLDRFSAAVVISAVAHARVGRANTVSQFRRSRYAELLLASVCSVV